MLMGRSTPPTSRPRVPQRPPRRTGLTCTSCRSPRSPCPWPSSRGVQVCEPRGPGGSVGRGSGLSGQGSQGRGSQGLLCPFLLGPGRCELAWGQPSALPWAAVQRGGDRHPCRGCPLWSWEGPPCAGRRGSSAVLRMPAPTFHPPLGTGWPLRDIDAIVPSGQHSPTWGCGAL